MFPGKFQFFYYIRSVIHRQAQISLYLCYISGIYLEAIFSFYIFLYFLYVTRSFGFVRLGSLCDIIKRYFDLTFASTFTLITLSSFCGKAAPLLPHAEYSENYQTPSNKKPHTHNTANNKGSPSASWGCRKHKRSASPHS